MLLLTYSNHIINLFQNILIIVGLIIFLLLFYGFIGPKWLKVRMRKFNTWAYKDGAVLFAHDPYKPIGPAMKEALNNAWPSNRHKRRVAYFVLALTAFVLIGLLVRF